MPLAVFIPQQKDRAQQLLHVVPAAVHVMHARTAVPVSGVTVAGRVVYAVRKRQAVKAMDSVHRIVVRPITNHQLLINAALLQRKAAAAAGVPGRMVIAGNMADKSFLNTPQLFNYPI